MVMIMDFGARMGTILEIRRSAVSLGQSALIKCSSNCVKIFTQMLPSQSADPHAYRDPTRSIVGCVADAGNCPFRTHRYAAKLV